MSLKNKVMLVVLCSAMTGSAQAGVTDVVSGYWKPTMALTAGVFGLYNARNARSVWSDWENKKEEEKKEGSEEGSEDKADLKAVEAKFKKSLQSLGLALVSAVVFYKLDGHGTVQRGLASLMSLFVASNVAKIVDEAAETTGGVAEVVAAPVAEVVEAAGELAESAVEAAF